LTAHRILRIKKVCQYVVQKLELELPKRSEYQKFLDGEANTGKSPSKLNLVQYFKAWKKKKEDTTSTTTSNEKPPSDDELIKPEEYLEILCEDKVLDPNYNLAIANTYFRGKEGAIKLKYRLKRAPRL
jgi:hypothetical protein